MDIDKQKLLDELNKELLRLRESLPPLEAAHKEAKAKSQEAYSAVVSTQERIEKISDAIQSVEAF